jgi:hypothetical protein
LIFGLFGRSYFLVKLGNIVLQAAQYLLPSSLVRGNEKLHVVWERREPALEAIGPGAGDERQLSCSKQ